MVVCSRPRSWLWFVPVRESCQIDSLIRDPPVADVANSKRHRRLDEIVIIFTPTIIGNQQSFLYENSVKPRAFITSLCCMKRAHYSKRMLRKHDCVKFRGRIA